jgi:hypothetical protein
MLRTGWTINRCDYLLRRQLCPLSRLRCSPAHKPVPSTLWLADHSSQSYAAVWRRGIPYRHAPLVQWFLMTLIYTPLLVPLGCTTAQLVQWLGYGMDGPVFESLQRRDISSLFQKSRSALGNTQPPMGIGVLYWRWRGWGVMLTIHLHIGPRLKKVALCLYSPHKPSLRE